jgi:hypothetical protein
MYQRFHRASSANDGEMLNALKAVKTGQQAQRTIGFSGSSGEKETSHGSSFSSID